MSHAISAYDYYLDRCRTGVRAEVQLGSPGSRDCRDLGICRVYVEGSKRDCGCGCCITAYLRIDVPTGRLLFHIENASIDRNTWQRFFQRDGFVIEAPFRLTPELAEALGLPRGNFRIETGTYTILDDGDFTTLSLRVVNAVSRRLPLLRRVA